MTSPDITRRRWLQAGLALASTPLVPAALAQGGTYPSRPVLVKIAFPPGGPADSSIRASSIIMQRGLGQPLVAENQPGATGSISAMAVLNAAHDGYTLLGTTGMDFLVAPLTISTARYQPASFRFLGITGISDFVLVSGGQHPFGTVGELITYASDRKNSPLTIAHWGTGSAPHIVGADFQARAGVSFVEVPYKGAAPASADVAGRQVDLTFVPMGGPTLGMIQNGKLKPIGLASARRHPALPDVPLLADHPRLSGFEYSQWAGLLAPPKTPDDVVTKLNAVLNDWIQSSENRTRIESGGGRQFEPMTPAQAQAFLAAEHDKVNRVARSLKLAQQ